MKMSFMTHKMIKSLAVAFASVSALVSCLQLDDAQIGDVGYLDMPVLDIDVAVDNPAQTKALDGFTVAEPSRSDVVFSVKEKGTDEELFDGEWPLTLTAGKTYVVDASHGSNIFGAPYFHASQEVTIQTLVKAQPSMTLSIGNSLVRVTLDSALDGHFLSPDGNAWTSADEVTLTSSAGDRKISYGEWTYVPSDESFSVTLDGVNSVGAPASFTYSLPSDTAPKTGYNIVCTKDATNWPTITIPAQQDGAWANRLYVTPGAAVTGNIPADQIEYQVSSDDWTTVKTSKKVGEYYVVDGLSNGTTYKVRARIGNIYSDEVTVTVKQDSPVTALSHYNDGSGNLAGTNANINHGFKGILKTLYDGGLLNVSATLSKGSTQMRTFGAESGTMSVANNWPYLPQGSDYVLTTSHKLSTESSAVTSTVSGLSVGAPSFTVSLGNTSYTNYDTYRSSGAAAANGQDPETIFDVTASCGISDDITGNSNYNVTLGYLVNDELKSAHASWNGSASASKRNISGVSIWASVGLKAQVVFDGVTSTSSSKTHNITGIPYKTTRPNSSGLHAWTGSGNVDWQDSKGVKLYPSDGSSQISFSHFYVPANESINVSVNHTFTRYDTFFTSLYYSVVVGSTTVEARSDLSNKETTYTRTNKEATLTSSAKDVVMKAEYSKLNTGTFYSTISLFEVYYR